MHACYALFFTAFIFHSVIESLFGLAFGALIVGVTFETDLVSSSVYDSVALTLKTLLGR